MKHDLLTTSFLQLVRRRLIAGRQIIQTADDRLQFQERQRFGSQLFNQSFHARFEDLHPRANVERQPALIDLHTEPAFVEQDGQLPRFQRLAVEISQHGQENSVPQLAFDGSPIDVEVMRVRRRGAIGENIPPPVIRVGRDAHVVRDNVENLPEAILLQRADIRPVLLVRSQLVVETSVIDHVIPVRAAFARFEQG